MPTTGGSGRELNTAYSGSTLREMTPNTAEAAAIAQVHRRVDRLLRLLLRVDIAQLPTHPMGPTIHACNHRSLADVLLAAAAFHVWGRPIRPLVAAAYFDQPVIGKFLRDMRCLPVAGIEALELAKEALEAGWSVAIMPEGRVVPRDEWVKDGVGRAHPGLARLALDTGLPIVVSGASGTEQFWPRDRRLPSLTPWSRFPVALRSEYLGSVTGLRVRELTDFVMTAMVRCIEEAEIATGIQR